MTTNKISFIGCMFVVVISVLTIHIINNFNTLDFIYLIFLIGCFIRFIYIRKLENKEE